MKDFKVKTDAISNAQYPTLNKVIPFYHSIFLKLNKFLECDDINAAPDIAKLQESGKTEEIVMGVIAARKKLEKYYKLALKSSLSTNATGKRVRVYCNLL